MSSFSNRQWRGGVEPRPARGESVCIYLTWKKRLINFILAINFRLHLKIGGLIGGKSVFLCGLFRKVIYIVCLIALLCESVESFNLPHCFMRTLLLSLLQPN